MKHGIWPRLDAGCPRAWPERPDFTQDPVYIKIHKRESTVKPTNKYGDKDSDRTNDTAGAIYKKNKRSCNSGSEHVTDEEDEFSRK